MIDLSRLGTFRGGRGVVALLRAGLLRIETREEPEAEERSADPALERGPMFAALTALSLSAAVAIAVTAQVG